MGARTVVGSKHNGCMSGGRAFFARCTTRRCPPHAAGRQRLGLQCELLHGRRSPPHVRSQAPQRQASTQLTGCNSTPTPTLLAAPALGTNQIEVLLAESVCWPCNCTSWSARLRPELCFRVRDRLRDREPSVPCGRNGRFINAAVLVLLAPVTTARRSAVVEIVFGLVAVVCIAATQRHLAPATRLKNQRAEGGLAPLLEAPLWES